MSTSSSESRWSTAFSSTRYRLPLSRTLALAIALLSWLALCAQTELILARVLMRGMNVLDGMSSLFSYLTNLTILLSAVNFSMLTMKRATPVHRFFCQPQLVSALVVYLVFIGITYHLLLRQLWHPSGFQAFVNESLHTVVPLMSLIYWIFFVPRFHASLQTSLLWLIYPASYLIITLWHGHNTGFYPYPFLHAGNLGYVRVLLNVTGLLTGFLMLMGLLLMINQAGKPTVTKS